MIRGLVLVFGLVLGLMLAILTEGRMAHLAALSGDRLPGWTRAISSDATVFSGSTAPLAGRMGVSAHWRLARIGPAGPVWRVQLSGAGVRLEGDLIIGAGNTARLNDLRGRVDLAALSAWEHTPEFAAGLEIARGRGEIDLDHGTLSTLQLEGFASGVIAGQSVLGEGRADAGLLADGRWHLHLLLAAGQAELEATGDGLGGILRLHVDQDRADLLPTGWGNPLPSDGDRLMVSYLLPIRPSDTD